MLWDFLFSLNIHPDKFIEYLKVILIALLMANVLLAASRKFINIRWRKLLVQLNILLAYLSTIFSFTVLARMDRYCREIVVIPFYSIYEMLIFEDFTFFIGVILNVLMFVPVGVCCKNLIKNKYVMFVVSVALSLFIEINQFVFRRGVFEIDDVICNTIGALIGYNISSVIGGIKND
ncbi:VanZ family protein [Ruminococcus sp. CLA-AA-H200]|uniref:VanZ family protein n=1 Tax=Ruminococcus turbiniformis TaxID=2881258 RepID=A0ABS8FYQ9_9FIRM|nr:VanZ family protein [Ruminococcus turbiniformis]MCC2255192.1 VanZ family protein [Ruminococcus turbiniformis]